jgi:peptidoglycan/xylan/chitin deacetylase (PgdA/CDA1 family)
MKFRNHGAQECLVTRVDSARDFLNELVANFTIFLAHLRVVEHGEGGLGNVHIFGHAAPRPGLTELVNFVCVIGARITQCAAPSAMIKIADETGTRNFMKLLAAALLASLSCITAVRAACPRPDTLGTSRVLRVDATAAPQVGLKQFPQTLPLEDHEVVLTFDDGPAPPMTVRVLETLAQQCVRATFFLVGKSASEHPELVRRIAAEGHTIGHHTWSHPSLMRMPLDGAAEEINRGISAVEKALHGVASQVPSTPFFRFPGFESTPATLELLKSRDIVVFGADLWASDWDPMTPDEELKLVTDRLKISGRGIILFHDPQARTAAMLPAFLRYLRDNRYRVVHLVPTDNVVSPKTYTEGAGYQAGKLN